MSQWDRMLQGKLYSCEVKDEKREALRRQCEDFMDAYNATAYHDYDARQQMIRKLFAGVGEDCHILKPFHCDYGCNITVGDHFFANFDCIMLDVNKINIGNHVMLAPRVAIYTAGHPIDKDVRNAKLEYGYEVNIGNDVWIGASTVINPGVTIGSNVVIGSNSVVTRDIPDNVVAAGNPCRVIRPITEEDKKYWETQAQDFYKNK